MFVFHSVYIWSYGVIVCDIIFPTHAYPMSSSGPKAPNQLFQHLQYGKASSFLIHTQGSFHTASDDSWINPSNEAKISTHSSHTHTHLYNTRTHAHITHTLYLGVWLGTLLPAQGSSGEPYLLCGDGGGDSARRGTLPSTRHQGGRRR